MGEICDVCQRPKWDGGHALNERECSQSRGEVCRLHAALAAANARADGFKSALELASKAGEQTQRELEEALAAALRGNPESVACSMGGAHSWGPSILQDHEACVLCAAVRVTAGVLLPLSLAQRILAALELMAHGTTYWEQAPFLALADMLRALIPPAAAPAAETGANEIGYCKTCGLDASHGVCNDPRDARIAELEAALRELMRAATEHANAHGCSGDLGARLSDARALLAARTSPRGAGEGT